MKYYTVFQKNSEDLYILIWEDTIFLNLFLTFYVSDIDS